jgi:hypothetical protein
MKLAPAMPDRAELRKFGLVLGSLFAAFFSVVPLLRHHPVVHLWPWVLAALLWVFALLRPSMLSYFYGAWTRLGSMLGWVNTRVILTLIYMLFIVPLGVVMRLCGRDRMARRFEPAASSYRSVARQRPAGDMEHPY